MFEKCATIKIFILNPSSHCDSVLIDSVDDAHSKVLYIYIYISIEILYQCVLSLS